MFIYRRRSASKTVVAIAIAIATSGPIVAEAQADAQDEIDERIRACGEIEDATERMDCFNAVVEGLNEDSDAADAPSSDVDAATAASASENSAVSGIAATTTVPSTATGTSAAVGTTATSAASAASEVDDFGLEDQKAAEANRKEKEQEAESGPVTVHATVVESQKSGLNHFVVALDNGQVWEETDGSRRIGLPDVGATVEVYKGRFGGYRMKFDTDNRVAWVRRLK